MKASDVTLFVYDTPENFKKAKEFIGTEGVTIKRMVCVEDHNQLGTHLRDLNPEELVFLAVHVFYTQNVGGIRRFMVSGIKENYPLLDYMYISDGDPGQIKHQMVDIIQKSDEVYKYHKVISRIESGEARIVTAKEALWNGSVTSSTEKSSVSFKGVEQFPECKYVIITALEETEMEKVLPMIEVTGKVEDDAHLIKYGHFRAASEKKVAFASQPSTGMIDAAILTTKMILLFKPKFVIMCGVLAGRPENTNIGDVIVSNRVFTIDKGKIVGADGKVAIEKFEKELEGSTTESSYLTELARQKEKIKEYLKKEDQTRSNNVEVHFGPVACVRSVINKVGYFEENLVCIDRKVIGLEMESYGVARACEQSKNRNVIPLIVKSVMDNAQNKTDDAKTYAAWTSAKFVEFAVTNSYI
jgi:nucleoside phosphorylase